MRPSLQERRNTTSGRTKRPGDPDIPFSLVIGVAQSAGRYRVHSCSELTLMAGISAVTTSDARLSNAK